MSLKYLFNSLFFVVQPCKDRWQCSYSHLYLLPVMVKHFFIIYKKFQSNCFKISIIFFSSFFNCNLRRKERFPQYCMYVLLMKCFSVKIFFITTVVNLKHFFIIATNSLRNVFNLYKQVFLKVGRGQKFIYKS